MTNESGPKPLDYYKALYHIAVEVTSRTDTEGVLEGIVQSTAEAMDVKGCSLMLLSPDRKHLVHTAAYGLSDSYIAKGPVDVGPILAEVLKGKPVAVYDVSTDRRIHYRSQAVMEGIVSMLS
ncbi:MAG: GAF domain-containing protein, partial [Chloroflexi bacterium]|nr:GAF domain-containing protein [Chloroflexota bacterium]